MTTTTTLYDALGGRLAIEAAVAEFYNRVLADPELAPFFRQTDLKRLKSHQRAFVAMALGGPAGYNGRAMHTAHAGRGIADAHFDRVAGHLAETLRSLGVAEPLVGDVLAAIAPLRGDIVDAPDTAATT